MLLLTFFNLISWLFRLFLLLLLLLLNSFNIFIFLTKTYLILEAVSKVEHQIDEINVVCGGH